MRNIIPHTVTNTIMVFINCFIMFNPEPSVVGNALFLQEQSLVLHSHAQLAPLAARWVCPISQIVSSALQGGTVAPLDELFLLDCALQGKPRPTCIMFIEHERYVICPFFNYTSPFFVFPLALSSIILHVPLYTLCRHYHLSPHSYLCIQGSVSAQPEEGPTGGRCSAGSYCPQGTSYMVPCPAGTFSSLDGDK